MLLMILCSYQHPIGPIFIEDLRISLMFCVCFIWFNDRMFQLRDAAFCIHCGDHLIWNAAAVIFFMIAGI